MTIAAGFNFNDGVLICADTKHSAGFSIDASKIFAKRYGNGAASVFAYAGSMRYCRTAIQHIESSIEDLERKDATLSTMRALVEEELKKLHTDNLYLHPGFRTGKVSVGFIGALWSPKEGLLPISIEDASVNEFQGYDCIGSGEYLGHYLIRPKYKSLKLPISFDSVVLLSAYALMSIKGYDEACGGKSEMVVVRKRDGVSPVRVLNITKGERYSWGFDKAVQNLYFALFDPKTTDAHMAAHLHAFQSNMKSIRRVSAEIQQLMDELDSMTTPPREKKSDGSQ
jgi:20S proteasome alpha/beta subunit